MKMQESTSWLKALGIVLLLLVVLAAGLVISNARDLGGGHFDIQTKPRAANPDQHVFCSTVNPARPERMFALLAAQPQPAPQERDLIISVYAGAATAAPPEIHDTVTTVYDQLRATSPGDVPVVPSKAIRAVQHLNTLIDRNCPPLAPVTASALIPKDHS